MAKPLEQMSDAELDEAIKSKLNVQSFDDYSNMSDADLDKAITEKLSKKTSGNEGQAFLESFGQSATLGYLPHLQSAVGSLVPNPSKDVDEQLKAQGVNIVQPEDNYVTRRDQNIKRIKTLQKENPKAALAGTAAGIGATMLVPIGTASKAATAAGRIARASATGAGFAGAANPGDTEGETGLQLGERFENAKTGALTGLLFQGGLEGLSKGFSRASKGLKKFSERRAVKSLGGNKGQVSKLNQRGTEQPLGRKLIDEKMVGSFSTPERIKPKVEAKLNDIGKEIGKVVESAGNKKVISGKDIADEILSNPEFVAFKNVPGLEGKWNAVKRFAQTVSRKKDMSVKELHDLRRGIDSSIGYNKKTLTGNEDVLKKIGRKLNEKINSAINATKGSQKDSLLRLNEEYSTLAQSLPSLESGVASQISNRSLSITDYMAALGGTAASIGTGNPLPLIAVAANKFLRTYGNSLGARGGDRLSKVLQGINKSRLTTAIKENPAAMQALMKGVTDVEFKKSDKSKILNDNEILNIFKDSPQLLQHIKNKDLKDSLKKKLDNPISRKLQKPLREPSNEAIERRLKGR